MASPSISSDRPRTTKFRFKSQRSRSPVSHSHHDSKRRSRHHHHHHHHRSKRRKLSPDPDLDPFAPRSLSPETAFRESLFDALADDEGADFWEGVYGQPIHAYPRPNASSRTSANADNGGETLEAMTDEEYVSYVRAKMWEKSHQHIIEERAKREEERARKKKRDEEARRWEEGIEEALRRGEERPRGKPWKRAWERYLQAWEDFVLRMQEPNSDGNDSDRRSLRKHIPWPVLSARMDDVNKGDVESFFKHAPKEAGEETDAAQQLAVLKLERFRWHPDKMQQRAGSGKIDEKTMQVVTAVFQVIDGMWAQAKSS